MKHLSILTVLVGLYSCGSSLTEDYYVVESLNTGFITQIKYDESATTSFTFYMVDDTVIVNTYYDYADESEQGPRIVGFNSNKMIPKGTNEITFSDTTYYDAYERYVIKEYKRIPISLD